MCVCVRACACGGTGAVRTHGQAVLGVGAEHRGARHSSRPAAPYAAVHRALGALGALGAAALLVGGLATVAEAGPTLEAPPAVVEGRAGGLRQGQRLEVVGGRP